MSKRSGKVSSNITYEDSNEDLIDEINTFHSKEREIKKSDIYRRKKFDRPEEVLNVEAEASDSSENEDSSDFDDDDVNDITDNKWGKKRKDFYGTGFVDEDWGGMREEEMEDAQLEEEDALSRQKHLDKSTAVISDLFEEDEEEDHEEKNAEVETVLEFNEANAKKKNKKMSKMIEQFAARRRIFELVVKPLENVIKRMPVKNALRSQLVYVTQTYASYLMNVAFLLKLKTEQFEKEKLEDPLIDIHPVNEEIRRLHKKITECEDFLHANSEQLDKLKNMAKKDIEELCEKTQNIKLTRKSTKINTSDLNEDAHEEMNGDLNEEEEKRKASDRIAKNREYADKRGKKKAKTSKTKNRRKVHTIEKRVKSQIGNVRREMHKYSGEAGGIRASTVKSTKLVA